MRLIISFYCQHSFIITDGDFFETQLIKNGMFLPESYGKDLYKVDGLIINDKILSGLGREIVYTYKSIPGSLTLEGRIGSPIEISDFSPEDSIKLKINTNIFLDQGLLTHHLGVRISSENKTLISAPLGRSDISINWFNRGQYYINISTIMCNIFKQGASK